MKRYIIVILCVIALLVVMALPCFAYEYNPLGDVVAVTTIRPTFSIRSERDGVQMTDVVPTSFRDPRDFISDVIYIEYPDNDTVASRPFGIKVTTYPWYSDPDAIYTVSVPNFVYTPSRPVVGVFALDDCSFKLTYDIYTLDGRYITEGVYEYDAIYGADLPEVDIESVLWDAAGDAGETGDAWKARCSLTISEWYYDSSIVVPCYPPSTLAVAAQYRGLSLDDTIVATYIDDVPIGEFLWSSVTGFLSFEIVEGVTLYMVLIAIIALPLILWFLKLVAGG